MVRLRRFGAVTLLLLVASAARAGNFLFVSPTYLKVTLAVTADSRKAAPEAFRGDADLVARLNAAADSLEERVSEVRRQQTLKKVKDDALEEREDAPFTAALNHFKDALNAMSDMSGKRLQDLLPSWDKWNRMEVALVSAGFDKRLSAYRTRFGPESEPVNLVEFLASQTLLAGDESGPSAWEPIARVAAIQATTRGSGLTSTAQLGVNRYFLSGAPPKMLRWMGVGNHIGLAAMLQYLDNPGVLELKGRPSFGLMLHLDRKEIGLSWDNREDRLNLTIGYAFQFVPLVM